MSAVIPVEWMSLVWIYSSSVFLFSWLINAHFIIECYKWIDTPTSSICWVVNALKWFMCTTNIAIRPGKKLNRCEFRFARRQMEPNMEFTTTVWSGYPSAQPIAIRISVLISIRCSLDCCDGRKRILTNSRPRTIEIKLFCDIEVFLFGFCDRKEREKCIKAIILPHKMFALFAMWILDSEIFQHDVVCVSPLSFS